MKSKWKVTSNWLGDVKQYAVYRNIDASQTDHSGNREYAGCFTPCRKAAESLAACLNAEEAGGKPKCGGVTA